MRAGSGAVGAEPGAQPCTGLPDPTSQQWPSPDGPAYARAPGWHLCAYTRRSGMRKGLLLGQINTDCFLTAKTIEIRCIQRSNDVAVSAEQRCFYAALCNEIPVHIP